MLNPFPIQFLALFAYFLLRFFTGSILIYLGLLHHHKRHELKDLFAFSWFPYGRIGATLFAVVELLIGGLLLVGAYTQYAALAGMLLCTVMLFVHRCYDHPSIPQKLFYLLLFAVLLSLFITGAGAIAFDLPI